MDDLLYLTFDSLQEGVGASQALAYVRKIARHKGVKIVSFEKETPEPSLVKEIQDSGIQWTPLPFGKYGILGGLSRIIRMWWHIDRKKIIHARGNLSALATFLRFPKNWIWDCRSLHADQRRALTQSRSANLSFVAMRVIEYFLAKFSTSIIVITNAVVPIFVSRYRVKKEKILVISTCVDTEKFTDTPKNFGDEINILLAGTFSSAYDVSLMNSIISELKRHRKVKVTVAASKGATPAWASIDFDFAISVPHEEMPRLVAESDLGMSIWKNDLGVCLSSVASTKTAEFLASGRPIIINSRQGDFGNLVSQNSVGIATDGSSESEIKLYVEELLTLLADPELSRRCRELAEKDFSLEIAVRRLVELYDSFRK